MSKTAQFKPYGFGQYCYVVLDQITHFEPYSSNNDSGTKIYFENGTDLLVGDYPETVREAIEGQDRKPLPIPPPLHYLKL